MSYKSKNEYKLIDNKTDISINQIIGIEIDDFRLFKNQKFPLGKNMTLVSGRNGTMKSTLMGLVAQPYRTEFSDLYEKTMHTKFSDVFKFSTKKDRDDYLYHIKMIVNGGLKLIEPIPLYFQPGNPNSKFSKKDRHRIVPSGRNKGDGYFTLPSVYINLKRLYPLIESKKIERIEVYYSEKEKQFISNFYERILLRTEFNKFEKFNAEMGNISKNTTGPRDSYYDVESISSGEDNLSYIADVLISFMRVYSENKKNGLDIMTGLLSIDEFDASLHPIAQLNLFKFLLQWSRDYNVQILISTHSLYLIQEVMKLTPEIDNERIKMNFIASGFQSDDSLKIYTNPSYELAYKELTLTEPQKKEHLVKAKILCEDEAEIKLLKKILGKNLNKYIDYQCTVTEDQKGTGKQLLKQLCSNFPKILKETRSIIIFDADCTEKISFKNFQNFFVTPSLYNLPIEKELVNFVLSLDGSSSIFSDLKMTKDQFKQSFSEYSISLNTLKTNDTKAKYYKNWHTEYGKLSGMLLTRYVKVNKLVFDDFKQNILELINLMFEENGLPKI